MLNINDSFVLRFARQTKSLPALKSPSGWVYCPSEITDRHIATADELAAMLQGLSQSLNKISESSELYVIDESPTTDYRLTPND